MRLSGRYVDSLRDETINLEEAMDGLSVLPQELFEAVLQHLDIKTLLFAQRVSRHWRTTIASSPQLQEALFCLPKTSETTRYSCEWAGDKLHRFGPVEPAALTKSLSTTSADPCSITSTPPFTPVTVNPLLVDEIFYSCLDYAPAVKRRGQRLVVPRLSVFLRHPTGSWRSMLLTQPPTARIVALMVDSQNGSPKCNIEFVEANCTLGGLVDRMLAASGIPASSNDNAKYTWNVMYVDAIELDHLAFSGQVSRYMSGRLVSSGREWNMVLKGKAMKMVQHPQPPIFSTQSL